MWNHIIVYHILHTSFNHHRILITCHVVLNNITVSCTSGIMKHTSCMSYSRRYLEYTYVLTWHQIISNYIKLIAKCIEIIAEKSDTTEKNIKVLAKSQNPSNILWFCWKSKQNRNNYSETPVGTLLELRSSRRHLSIFAGFAIEWLDMWVFVRKMSQTLQNDVFSLLGPF